MRLRHKIHHNNSKHSAKIKENIFCEYGCSADDDHDDHLVLYLSLSFIIMQKLQNKTVQSAQCRPKGNIDSEK